jgi:PTS system fructose-specific IIC component
LVLPRLKEGYAGGRADANRRWLSVRADGAGTGGFIAFSIADRPGLTPGLIGGMLAVSTGSGFIGGIIAGFLAGYVAKAISKAETAAKYGSAETDPDHSAVSSLMVGLAMIYLIGKPVAGILAGLTHWLQTMGTANAVLLGAILGGMMCTDMGGPVNKAAYAFGVGLLSTQTYAPMAAIMAAGMVPPLALGLATIVAVVSSIKRSRKAVKPRWFWACALSPKVRFRSRLVTRCVFCHAVSSAAR